MSIDDTVAAFATATVTATATAIAIAPESVSIHMERPPVTTADEEEYLPLTLDAVNQCDLSYFNDKWSEDMIRDGMRSIVRVGQLPEVRDKEINVWKYLSQYSPPAVRGFMFSYGDDRIVTLVGDNMETGHSGASMGWTMRNIEFIAKNGLPAHRARFLNSRNHHQNN
jgi:hypothetical protein